MSQTKHFHIKQGSQFEVKELFKDLSRLVRAHFPQGTANLDVLDVGCASGELPVFFKRDFGTAGTVMGLDLSAELVANAQARFAGEGVEFFAGDASNFKVPRRFDAITMTSVLSYFDEPLPVIQNMLDHLKPGGMVLISGIFNPWDIDVRLKFQVPGQDKWSTINQFGMQRLARALQEKGYTAQFIEQVMPFEIKPKEHPVRSWTVDLDGKRHMMCGLQVVYNIQILTITRSKAL